VLYNNIGMLLISENRIQEAGPYLEEALKIQSQQPMKQRRDLWARYLNNYGCFCGYTETLRARESTLKQR
jgi:hypothetical protein